MFGYYPLMPNFCSANGMMKAELGEVPMSSVMGRGPLEDIKPAAALSKPSDLSHPLISINHSAFTLTNTHPACLLGSAATLIRSRPTISTRCVVAFP